MTFVWAAGTARTAVRFAVAAFLGAGCATIQRYEITETERMLAAAGFQRRPADTSERREELRSIPPHRIVSRTRDGKVEYVYADAEICGCVYVGSDSEYSEYERLKTQIAPRTRGSSPSGGAVGGAP